MLAVEKATLVFIELRFFSIMKYNAVGKYQEKYIFIEKVG